jgi:hypothetical protein
MLVLESTWCRGRQYRCKTKAMLCVLNSGFFCEFVWSDEFEIQTSWPLCVRKIMYFFSWVYHKTKEKGSPWSCCVKVHVLWIKGDEVFWVHVWDIASLCSLLQMPRKSYTYIFPKNWLRKIKYIKFDSVFFTNEGCNNPDFSHFFCDILEIFR